MQGQPMQESGLHSVQAWQPVMLTQSSLVCDQQVMMPLTLAPAPGSEALKSGARKRTTRRSKKAQLLRAPSLSFSEASDDAVAPLSLPERQQCPLRARWGEPSSLYEDREKANEVIAQLENLERGEVDASAELVNWLLPYSLALACSKEGTHVIQKALEFADRPDRERLTSRLRHHIRELYESPHGNHVLAKMVEVLPSSAVQFIISSFRGKARDVARHQYACRILERLIEHCSDEGEMSLLLDEIVVDSESLCRHAFGNFVVQHLLEHGSPQRQQAILSHVVHKLPALAMHRTASHFVQQLLNFCEPAFVQVIATKLLTAEGQESLLQVAGSRYGSFVVEQLANTDARQEVRQQLLQGLPYFTEAQLKFAKRVIDRFDLQGVTALSL